MSDVFEQLYQTYKKPIYNYLYRSTVSRHLAEELTQETFLKAFKSYSSFKGNSTVITWLFTIARNSYLNEMNRKGYQLEEQFDPTIKQFSDHGDAFKAVDERLLIQKVLYQLPERSRTLLILRDQNGMTYKELAAIFSETEGQIKIGLFRARKKFKELYQSELKEGES